MFDNLRACFKFGRVSTNMVMARQAGFQAITMGNKQKGIQFLKQSLLSGYDALSIDHKFITQDQRDAVNECISETLEIYQLTLIDQMSEEDQELCISALKAWSYLSQVVAGDHQIGAMTEMFDLAKRRLSSDKDGLGIIYNYQNKHVPMALLEIMSRFLTGESTQDETEKQLDDCKSRLTVLIGELFPGDILGTT